MLLQLLPTALGGCAADDYQEDNSHSSRAGSVLLSPPEAQSDDEEEAAPEATHQRIPEVSDSEEEEEASNRQTTTSRAPAAETNLDRFRPNDAEFNALVELCKKQETLIDQIRSLVDKQTPTTTPVSPFVFAAVPAPLGPSSSDDASTAMVLYNQLNEFELQILLSTHDARGRKYTPGANPQTVTFCPHHPSPFHSCLYVLTRFVYFLRLPASRGELAGHTSRNDQPKIWQLCNLSTRSFFGRMESTRVHARNRQEYDGPMPTHTQIRTSKAGF